VYAKATAAELASFPDLITKVNGVDIINRARKRLASDPAQDPTGLNPNWTWSWPVNRRIIYNRASIDLNGTSWDPNRTILSWDAEAKAWKGDVVDGFGAYGPINSEASAARKILPFIMNADGMARLWGGATMNDGPLPEVYEPWESPFDINLIGHGQINDPTAYYANPSSGFAIDGVDQNPKGTVDEYPYVATTYRCTDHWQTGIMTRNLPLLNELSPNMYVEIGEDLADELGIKPGDAVKVSSARGSIEAVAVVTKRFAAITCGDKTIHQVGILNHWGYSGLSKGDTGNILTPHIGDANTSIPEFKTFLCKVEKA
jgi:formate dehydrogenase major subunit